MYSSLLLNLFTVIILLLVSCFPNDAEDIPEVCFEESGLLSWTINDVPQAPNISLEPNTGLNPDFLYSLDRHGSWTINFTNDEYTIVFADFDNLISSQEIDDLSESEWEKVMEDRGSYDFVFESDGRQELFLNAENPIVYLGDSADEVLGGKIQITVSRTSICSFLELDVTAILGSPENPYTVKIKLKEPYLYD